MAPAPPHHHRRSFRVHRLSHGHGGHGHGHDHHEHHNERRHSRRDSILSRDGSESQSRPETYVSEVVDHHHGHRHHHHEKFLLVQGAEADADSDARVHTVPNERQARISQGRSGGNKEHIEVIIRQPPPQQIQLPTQQPIVINTGEDHEHNHWLTEATDGGPSAKKKRTSLEGQEVIQVAEGTGKSMAPLTETDKPRRTVEFAPGGKGKGKGVLRDDGGEAGGDDDEHRLEKEDDGLELRRQYGEHCPLCGLGVLQEEFTWTGWLFAILCFPCGIFLLFSSKAVTCSRCRQVFRL